MQLCFTVDWEDWYHGLGLPDDIKAKQPRRIKVGHDILMNLLDKYKIKATFYVLGESVQEFPELVKEIQQGGHEIGCHTWSHSFVYDLTPQQFHEEIKKCKEVIKPFQDGYENFRAPYFSITEKSKWALDILKQEGFTYDSSIFPGNTFRTGIIGFDKQIHTLPNGLKEFPISNFPITKFDVGVGGAYFRILPYPYFKYKLKSILKNRPGVFYFHPWEFDHQQPYIGKGVKQRAVHTHYANLAATERKIEKLFKDFEFTTFKEIMKSKGL